MNKRNINSKRLYYNGWGLGLLVWSFIFLQFSIASFSLMLLAFSPLSDGTQTNRKNCKRALEALTGQDRPIGSCPEHGWLADGAGSREKEKKGDAKALTIAAVRKNGSL